MQVWTTLGQKGGSGKTTLATNLAVAAELAGQSVLLIDTDPQRSAADWGDSRESDQPGVLAASADRLVDLIRRAERAEADLVIVDAAPHAEKAAADCAAVADLVFMPTKPTLVELRTARATRDIAAATQTPLVSILLGIAPRGPVADQAQAALEALGIDVAPVRWGYRTAYQRAFAMSLGVLELSASAAGPAWREVDTLFDWINGGRNG